MYCKRCGKRIPDSDEALCEDCQRKYSSLEQDELEDEFGNFEFISLTFNCNERNKMENVVGNSRIDKNTMLKRVMENPSMIPIKSTQKNNVKQESKKVSTKAKKEVTKKDSEVKKTKVVKKKVQKDDTDLVKPVARVKKVSKVVEEPEKLDVRTKQVKAKVATTNKVRKKVKESADDFEK